MTREYRAALVSSGADINPGPRLREDSCFARVTGRAPPFGALDDVSVAWCAPEISCDFLSWVVSPFEFEPSCASLVSLTNALFAVPPESCCATADFSGRDWGIFSAKGGTCSTRALRALSFLRCWVRACLGFCRWKWRLNMSPNACLYQSEMIRKALQWIWWHDYNRYYKLRASTSLQDFFLVVAETLSKPGGTIDSMEHREWWARYAILRSNIHSKSDQHTHYKCIIYLWNCCRNVIAIRSCAIQTVPSATSADIAI